MARMTRERTLLALAVLLCILFAIALPGFLTADNLLDLVSSIPIPGIPGVTIGLVANGHGIGPSLLAPADGRHCGRAGTLTHRQPDGHRADRGPLDRRARRPGDQG